MSVNPSRRDRPASHPTGRPPWTRCSSPACTSLSSAHRTVYIGLHVPSSRRSRRRHRRHGHRRHRHHELEPEAQDEPEPSAHGTPSQRVQFLLGMEDDDEEHIPHDLFIQLDELCLHDGEYGEWKETARWLKFEEHVEDGGERWSKPYVASLSLHSLFELRNCITNGTVLFDMKAGSLEEIVGQVVEDQISSELLSESMRERVKDVLLQKHHHQSENKLRSKIPIMRSFADMSKKHSGSTMLDKNDLSGSHLSLSASRLSLFFHSLKTKGKHATSTSPTSSPPSSGSPTPTLSRHFDGSSADGHNPANSYTNGLLAAHHSSTHGRALSLPDGHLHPNWFPAPENLGLHARPREHDSRKHANTDHSQVILPVITDDVPNVVVHPPVEEQTSTKGTGLLTSPQPLPVCLEAELKDGEPQLSLSRENINVDFSKVDHSFMKKIPPGAEASNVFVGELQYLEKPFVAFVRLSPALLLSGITEVPIPSRFIFILLGPPGKAQEYHEIGRSIATLMSDEIFHDVAYKAKDRSDLLAGIDEFLDLVTVLPPGEWDPSIRIEPPKTIPSQEKRKTPGAANGAAPVSEPEHEAHEIGPELQSTGQVFGGLVQDVKRKAPWYLSDYRDGLNLQCLASFLFLYCACMSPVITFGGLLGEATEDRISAIESLLGASMTGMAYSLFAGQPLTILGSTGPVLIFEKILFKFCKEYHVSYLSLRACIGLWTAFYCLILVAADASSLVCYITRFTEEAFASLICLIFIYEALEKLVHLGVTYPIHMHDDLNMLTQHTCTCAPPQVSNVTSNGTNVWTNQTVDTIAWENLTVSDCKILRGVFVGNSCSQKGPYVPDVLFWSVILFFSTFFLSGCLKNFKTTRYFPTKVRAIISDFAVFLTIALMVVLDCLVGIPSPKLKVPSVFKPTRDDRGWIVNPMGRNPWWTIPAASVPALLCTILIFMDQQITAVIINRKEHKLKKGCGYHLDLLWVAIMLGICSIMGLPWFVAATVLSISHVNSLKLESECSAPGEQPKFLGIREQRFTGFMIFLLMGFSVFMTSILQFIPMPVLYAVFLYMGVSSLKGIQFYDRIKLFGMPAKHQPDFIYLRHVPLRKVHLFTFIQLSCLVILWIIKTTRAAIVFPMMVLALLFVRKILYTCFSKRELSWLDDVMPESRRKKLDDDLRQKKLDDEDEDGHSQDEQEMHKTDLGSVEVPLKGGNILKIPLKSIHYRYVYRTMSSAIETASLPL
uniref:Anion exchange protein n=1 Tax=Eptatretus burgeri TaxID=7764 RepID=A0A8C4QRI2_EPTBU